MFLAHGNDRRGNDLFFSFQVGYLSPPKNLQFQLVGHCLSYSLHLFLSVGVKKCPPDIFQHLDILTEQSVGPYLSRKSEIFPR